MSDAVVCRNEVRYPRLTATTTNYKLLKEVARQGYFICLLSVTYARHVRKRNFPLEFHDFPSVDMSTVSTGHLPIPFGNSTPRLSNIGFCCEFAY